MKAEIRNTMAGTAAISLLALVGCSEASSNGEDADTNGDADNAEAAPSVEDVPALSEIEDLMWESMEEAGSVTVSADLEDVAGSDPAGFAMFEEVFGSDQSNFLIYGDLDGSASAMSIGENDLIVSFGEDEAYMSADVIFSVLVNQAPEMSAGQEDLFDQLSEEFSGNWLDYSEELQSGGGDDFNVSGLYSSMRDSWANEEESAGSPVEREEIADEGSHEVRDGDDVWVYAGGAEGQDLVLTAEHQAPKIVEVTDDEMTMTFSDWGETQAPERPDESDVMTEQEIEQRLAEAMMGG
ncbi:MAG: hypothetical protein ACTHV8_05070 [Nesterenkonia sp.]